MADRLDPLVLAANVFGGAPTADEAAFDSTDWRSVPALTLTGGTGEFVLRHNPESLMVLATLATGDAVELAYGDLTVVVGRDGSATGGATATVREADGGWQAIVHVPSERGHGDSVDFDLRVLAGGVAVGGWNTPGSGAKGNVAFMEDLSLTSMVQASRLPVLGEGRDSVWDEAVWFTTDTPQQGPQVATGARADAAALWFPAARQVVERRDGSLTWVDTMFLRAEVTDPDINVANSNPWERDGIELFLDLGNAKNGSYRAWEDAQLRFEATEVSWTEDSGAPLPAGVTFGSGDTGRQEARVHQVHVELTETGYVLEVEVGLWFFNEHPSADNRHSQVGGFHGFDVQVNDATTPADQRTSVWTWANPTTEGWNSTASWGTIQQVGPAGDDAPVAPPMARDELTSRNSGSVAVSGWLSPGGTTTLRGLPGSTDVAVWFYVDGGAPLLVEGTTTRQGHLEIGVPADVTPGRFPLAVFCQDGSLLGWNEARVR